MRFFLQIARSLVSQRCLHVWEAGEGDVWISLPGSGEEVHPNCLVLSLSTGVSLTFCIRNVRRVRGEAEGHDRLRSIETEEVLLHGGEHQVKSDPWHPWQSSQLGEMLSPEHWRGRASWGTERAG